MAAAKAVDLLIQDVTSGETKGCPSCEEQALSAARVVHMAGRFFAMQYRA